MSFVSTFYTIKDSKNTINKTLENGEDYNILLKESSSIDNLIIDIHTNNQITNFNYCYIPIFNRYYFVNDIEIFPTNIYRLHLHIDVLETYKEDILKIKGNVYNATTDYQIIKSDVTLSDVSNLILVTIGGVE